MTNYRGSETLQKYFSGDKIYFVFPRWKKFVASRYPNFRLFQNVYAENVRQLTKNSSLHATQKPKRLYVSKNFIPTPGSISPPIRQDLVEDLPPLAVQFIDTHLHVTSRKQGSFSKA